MRNPNWSLDETILALDLYFRIGRKMPSESHPEVAALSKLLNSLGIHSKGKYGENFRNPDGVAMKLGNLQFHDNTSSSGLPAGSKIDKLVWEQYGHKPEEVKRLAGIIRSRYQEVASEDIAFNEGDEEFSEGRIIEKLHKRLERSGAAPKQKKANVLRMEGKLVCEVCNFDFFSVYGELGAGFAECHHKVPLSYLGGVSKTKLSDLAIVCSNCHRILHRKRPWLTVEELSAIIPYDYKKRMK